MMLSILSTERNSMLDYLMYAVIISCASAVSVIAGFGFATISLAMLAFVMPLKQALILIAILHLLVSLYKVTVFRGSFNRISLFFIGAGAVGSFTGAQLVGLLSPAALKKGLASVLLVYPLLIVYRPKIRMPQTAFFALLGGASSGFFAGLVGMGGVLRSFFLSLYNLPKEVYVASGGLIALSIDITRISVYLSQSPMSLHTITIPLLMSIPALLIGLLIGMYFVDKIPQESFRFVVAISLAVFGFSMLFLGF